MQIYPEGNQLVAVLRNEYSTEEEERLVDQIVCEHGTLPEEDLYFALKPHSTNLGEIDLYALRGGEAQGVVNNPHGSFSCCGSATRWPVATSMPQSTTRCASAKTYRNEVVQALDRGR